MIAKQIASLTSVKNGAPIACLGLSYKADIDDLRESPSIHVVTELRNLVDNPIIVVEPHTKALPKSLVALADTRLMPFDEAVAEAGAVVLLTDHKAFSIGNGEALKGKDILDTRGAWSI